MSDFISGNRYLSTEEQHVNAKYIYSYLSARGWTINAIAGMLGNMETESTINPAIWENLDPSDPERGYGLVQWTPSTKYTEWCDSEGIDPAHMMSALLRIEYEFENGIQFYPTDEYPITWSEFKTSTLSPSYLGMAFLYNYERPASLDQPSRGTQAETWYNYLLNNGGGGVIPDSPVKKKKGLSLLMMYIATRK